MSVQPPGNAESSNLYSTLRHAFLAAIKRVDTSLSPTRSIQRIWTPTLSIFHLVIGGSCLTIRPSYTLAILFAIWMIALTIPFTSQFFVPATPMLLYLLTVHSVGLFPVRSLPIMSVHLAILCLASSDTTPSVRSNYLQHPTDFQRI
ncbi:hypothetical protein BDZ97DRAFT_2019659 [Flammula alnicola]|nr:hypothetical protein BDZ97DRAFT_2019659 [Flammula alnicola]